ncbi:MAG TPA: A24 family peptidase, partial [Armatimonadota bacterium]|nr:A24 family peptidase [Armatimonadota bacterium]
RRQIAEQESQWANEGILEEGERLDAMGMGDVKLAAVMGANLGIAGGLVALLTGVFIGAVFGLALKAMKRLEGHAIPFGPALIIGLSVSVFLGGDVIRWYLSLLAGG